MIARNTMRSGLNMEEVILLLQDITVGSEQRVGHFYYCK
jgi:hypothetical protein